MSILTVIDRGTLPESVQMIDSAIVRAHHYAAGAKGGFKSEIQLLTNARGLPN